MNHLIGNTPIIKINYKYKGKENFLYAKLEYYNLTGSIKDRIAYYIIKKAKEKKILKDGRPIIEATSGNTGISFAALGAYYKHPVHIFMPEFVSKERRKIIEMYGAKIHLTKNFKEAIKGADNLAKEINGYRPNQFENEDNIKAHYETTAKEILEKLPDIKQFVSGIGTGGTLMGIAKRLKEHNKEIKIHALEPDSMPLLSQNKIIKQHKIEGIGDDFIPKIVDKNLIDNIILINDEDAINMSKKLAHLGLGLGISSGANFVATALINNNDSLTIFVDDNKKYLSTDLSTPINPNKNLISNQIELLSFETIE